MAFTLQAACLSHIGNRRGNNEDNFFFNGICLEEEHTSTHDPLLMERVLQEDVCLGVFDGMGGENSGEQASFTAASEMQALTGKPKLFYQSGGKYLGNLALALNDAVFRRAQELPEPSGADPYPEADTHMALIRAIGRLPQKYRAAVLLYYYQDMTAAETAAALGIREDAVYQRLRRARQQLKKELEEQ